MSSSRESPAWIKAKQDADDWWWELKTAENELEQEKVLKRYHNLKKKTKIVLWEAQGIGDIGRLMDGPSYDELEAME